MLMDPSSKVLCEMPAIESRSATCQACVLYYPSAVENLICTVEGGCVEPLVFSPSSSQELLHSKPYTGAPPDVMPGGVPRGVLFQGSTGFQLSRAFSVQLALSHDFELHLNNPIQGQRNRTAGRTLTLQATYPGLVLSTHRVPKPCMEHRVRSKP